MRRKIVHPYGQTVSGFRLVSMLTAVLVLWMFYHRLKDPATWRDFASAKEDPVVLRENDAALRDESENIVPGPNDQDKEEFADIQEMFEFVTDRAPLKFVEMNAYWRLMHWSRTESFADLEKRSHKDVLFRQIWEEPARYRGTLIRLQIHAQQAVRWDTKENPSGIAALIADATRPENVPWDTTENPSGIAAVCEVVGPTDGSSLFPYMVVFPDPPKDFPIGEDLRTEIVFVGYFFKIMTYTARDGKNRGLPLLIGRAKLISKPRIEAPSKLDPWVIPLIVAGGTIFIGITIWTGMRTRKKSKVSMLPTVISSLDISESPGIDDLFGQFDNIPQATPKVETPILDVVTRSTEQTPLVADAKVSSQIDSNPQVASKAEVPVPEVVPQSTEQAPPASEAKP